MISKKTLGQLMKCLISVSAGCFVLCGQETQDAVHVFARAEIMKRIAIKPDDRKQIESWFREKAISVSKTGYEEAFKRLDQQDNFSRYKVFYMGESIHGEQTEEEIAGEFCKYLVTHHGLKSILVETPMSCAENIDRAVCGESDDNKIGDYFTVNRQIYQVMGGKGFYDLAIWLRHYNQGKTEVEKVHFCGFGQGPSKVRVKRIAAFLRDQNQETLAMKLESTMADFDQTFNGGAFDLKLSVKQIEEIYGKYLAAFAVVKSWLDRHGDEMPAGILNDVGNIESILHVGLYVHLEMIADASHDDKAEAGYFVKDLLWAERQNARNIEHLLKTHGGPVMVYAHKAHVNADRMKYTDPYWNFKPMRSYLDADHIGKAYTINLYVGQGEVFCVNNVDGTRFPDHYPLSLGFDGSFETVLDKSLTDGDVFLAGLRHANGKTHQWLHKRLVTTGIGAVSNQPGGEDKSEGTTDNLDRYSYESVRKNCDALLFVKHGQPIEMPLGNKGKKELAPLPR